MKSAGETSGYCAIQWIVIFPADSVIHLLNNWGLVFKALLGVLMSRIVSAHQCSQHLKGFLKMSDASVLLYLICENQSNAHD